ncbi:hypothetical protein SB725_31400, partial [Pseudomonas sp. SIMBA_041]
ENEGTDEEPLPEGIHASEKQRVANDFEEQRADDSSNRRTITAKKICAADDRTGNHLKLLTLTQRIGRSTQPAYKEDGRQSGNRANKHI